MEVQIVLVVFCIELAVLFAGFMLGVRWTARKIEERCAAFLLTDRARFRIAGVARSVAKDYLQQWAQDRGEVWEP